MGQSAIGIGGWLRFLYGLAIWLGLFFYLPAGDENGVIARLLLFALLVVFPLALPQIEPSPENRDHIFKTAVFLQPIAATITAVSFLIEPGVLSATFAVVWLPFSLFLAWHAVKRLKGRGPVGWLSAVEETCVDAAMLYIPIGSVWLLAGRLGTGLLGFSEPIVSLTAVHFHFAGFAGAFITGLAGRRLHADTRRGRRARGRWLYFPVACLVILGPALVAAGISFSPLIEMTAAALLAAAYFGLGMITVFFLVPSFTSAIGRLCLVVSSLAIMVAMSAAVVFSFGQYGDGASLSIPQMLSLHGWLNAVGFALLGLLGWAMVETGKKPPSGR